MRSISDAPLLRTMSPAVAPVAGPRPAVQARVWAWVWAGAAAAAFLAPLLPACPASAFETTAPTAILLDFATGKTLFQKDADRETPPASLAKLMTIAVIFDALKSGEITRDETFTVSRKAWSEAAPPPAVRPCSCRSARRSASTI